jgi:hypothetical protein
MKQGGESVQLYTVQYMSRVLFWWHDDRLTNFIYYIFYLTFI